jgi:hypothetical protein
MRRQTDSLARQSASTVTAPIGARLIGETKAHSMTRGPRMRVRPISSIRSHPVTHGARKNVRPISSIRFPVRTLGPRTGERGTIGAPSVSEWVSSAARRPHPNGWGSDGCARLLSGELPWR